ncbi:tetratricopeptide repeat protein [Agrobacterium vitis]|uniref:Tetratricopeptide repeat protein n=1 Tax=Agrobacterium vitis TaxID=373 RepID=A0A6L6VI05_AGRVI|nr:tetratricopeptide repeat protein [Agrobacterium vitis]
MEKNTSATSIICVSSRDAAPGAITAGTELASPTPGQIRKAVDQLCNGNTFATAKRSRQLLQYLVEEALAGRANAIGEHAIAQDVFGKDQHFDPRIDTCVRTEAWRLRNRLQSYYEHEGHFDVVRVAFMPRSLVPIFSSQPSLPAADIKDFPRRIAMHLDSEPDAGENEQRLARQLPQEIASSLFKLSSIIPVLPGGTSRSELELRCAIRSNEQWIRIVTTMVDLDGLVQGSKTFSFPQKSESPSPTLIANAIGEMVSDSLSRSIVGQAVDVPGHSDKNENRFLDQLLRGSHINRRERLIELRAAVLRYEQIISDDPLDQLSHRRLIGALGQFLSLAPGSISRVMPKLAASAHSALSLNGNLSDVWLILGWASSYAYDWPQTERACRQAIAITPLDPSPYILLALTYLQSGQIVSALQIAEEAINLDPYSPMVANVYALTLNAARRFTEAAKVARDALEAEPGFVKLRLTYGEAKLNMGQIDSAIEEFTAASRIMTEDATACGLLGLAYGLSGEISEAGRLLSRVKQSPNLRGQAVHAEAMIHLGLGARDEAIRALELAVTRRGTPGLFLANAVFDPIRDDSRFSKIQHQMELAH